MDPRSDGLSSRANVETRVNPVILAVTSTGSPYRYPTKLDVVSSGVPFLQFPCQLRILAASALFQVVGHLLIRNLKTRVDHWHLQVSVCGHGGVGGR
jgi:hypothetical protein